jgi:hypothetical protein
MEAQFDTGATQAILIFTGSACAVPAATVAANAAKANFSDRMTSSPG